MRLLIPLIIFSKLIFAQYDSTMYDLIKTTYERSFDRSIELKYLNSKSEHKIKAAILSISHCEDTLFVPDLIGLDLSKYGNEVCFALGQIGQCSQSIKFLWEYINSSPLPEDFPKIFFAIGKIGNENDLTRLVEFYNSWDSSFFPYEGISDAILQSQLRGIKSDNAKAILENEISHKHSPPNRIIKALFVLSRYGGSENLSAELNNFLSGSSFLNGTATEDIKLKQYVLMIVKKEVFIKSEKASFIDEVHNKPLLLIQFAKILHLFRFNTNSFTNANLNIYFELLNDKNPNIAIQAAISIKNIKDFSNDSLKIKIRSKIDELIYDQTRPMIFRGELFLSRYELFGNYSEHEKILKELELPVKYKIQFYAKNLNKEDAFIKISKFYWDSSNLKDKIESLTQILELKSFQIFQAECNKILLNSLGSDQPPLISIAADGIDSLLISKNKVELKYIIENQITKLKDNADFLEATMSLVILSEKIDKDFSEIIIEKIKSSNLYSIRKIVPLKTGILQIGFKELDKFEEIWSYAFKYRQADIKTTKGTVKIDFNSDIAPISVANFCMLAKKNFYNGIVFHRVVPGFVIQAGDPTATGWGGPGYDIVSEFSNTDFGVGYVGMASAGKDTESSQFFIMQGSYPHLDSRYTLFAKVIEGMEVVYDITEDDRIISIELE